MAQNIETTVYVIEMRDKFTMGMRKATAASDRFNNSVKRVNNNTTGLTKSFGRLGVVAAAGFALAVAGMAKLGFEAVKTASKFEAVEKALEVMTGRKGLGAGLMDWAKEFSRTTIITFDQTVTSMRKLLAYGVSNQNVKPLTELLSTIGAGVGTDRLPYLTLALGQVKSRGRLMGTELRQFREHGVDIISELAKGLKVKTPIVEEMVTKGLVSFDMVVAAMQGMVGKGGRFENMLEEMAKTTEGRFNILKSTWSIAMAGIGEQMLPVVNAIMDTVIPPLEKLSRLDWSPFGDGLERFADTMTRLMGVVTQKSFFRIIYEEFVTFFFNMSGVADRITTELEILKKAFSRVGDVFGNLFKAAAAEFSGDFEGRDAAYADLKKSFGELGGQSDYATQQRNLLAWRLIRNETDKLRMLAAKTTPGASADPGEYIPNGLGTGAEAGDKKKTKTNRAVGTGARDIIINIGSLMDIENQSVNGTDGESSEQIMRKLQMALLTVVKDVSLTVR